MKPYDKDGLCPKCGHDDIRTCHYGRLLWLKERMHRQCRRCEAEWYESPLDAQVPADAVVYRGASR